jgi:asparagine synthase (glutamine-hydrolysing)
MCGIAGVFRPGGEAAEIERCLLQMQDVLRHRGPDDRGTWLAPDCGIGLTHTRLSILDLSPAGHQPMLNPDSQSWLTYNGEIYNYKELRAELDGESKRWQSETDTEVILKAYERWGVGFLNQLRGMFALAIWDSRREQLLLARDPFGIKPLYYYSNGTSLVFASEVRALLASGNVPKQLCAQGLASYFQFGSVISPLTMIEGVRSLPPGRYLTVSPNSNGLEVEESCYAEKLFSENGGAPILDRHEAVRDLRDKLEESIHLHLVSDVPLAAFLSGGIDSSAIVALMSRVAEERPKTFSIVFEEKEFSEASYARLIAEKFETDHHEILLSESALFRMLPDALAAMDQPTIDGINSYVISRAVKDAGITVALSGLGGDELFAGYPSFRRVQKLRNLSVIPSSIRKAAARTGLTFLGNSVQQRKAWNLLAGGGTPLSAYMISRQVFSQEESIALMNGKWPVDANQFLDGASSKELPADSINEVSLYELQGYMANMLLRDTDQMSMAHSLEVRVPFVDSVIVPFVLRLPGKWKVDGRRPKPLLLDAVADLLPPEIWQRPKMGFTLPFARWMRSALKPDIDQAFADTSGLARIGITQISQSFWQAFEQSFTRERWSRPWGIYVLKRWCDINSISI